MRMTAMMMLVTALGLSVGCVAPLGDDEQLPGATKAPLVVAPTDAVGGRAAAATAVAATKADDKDKICEGIFLDCMDVCYKIPVKSRTRFNKCQYRCTIQWDECLGIVID